jgi:hypothetical protein
LVLAEIILLLISLWIQFAFLMSFQIILASHILPLHVLIYLTTPAIT